MMSKLRLENVSVDFHRFATTRVQQGETVASHEPIGVILKSCVCAGFYHDGKKIGALTHITGFRKQEAHHAQGALDAVARELRREGLQLKDCECFIIGGADRSRHVYEDVISELTRRGLKPVFEDALGRYHRKAALDPATGIVTLYKRPDTSSSSAPIPSRSSDDSAYGRFSDPKRRVVTGASLLFRNARLLEAVRTTVVPYVLRHSRRFHIWCAGCSSGMEAYSVAMVVLNAFQTMGASIPFKVLGTDISEDSIATAERGIYLQHSTIAARYAPVLSRYMEKREDRYVSAGALLRSIVSFQKRDIAAGSRRHRFEFVICDHVLQYFDTSTQWIFLESMASALQPGGFLYASTPSHVVQHEIPEHLNVKELERHLYQRLV